MQRMSDWCCSLLRKVFLAAGRNLTERRKKETVSHVCGTQLDQT